MQSNPDNELVSRLIAGDTDAFDALYHKYSRSLYANIFKLIKDPVAAEDILQEVFIALWTKRTTLDVDQPVSNWLFSVSYYNSLKHVRKVLKEEMAFKALGEEADLPNGHNSEEREISMDAIRNAISQLSAQKQRVFLGCKVAGKTYKEVAEELTISRHTVKEYLSLAITSLRTILK